MTSHVRLSRVISDLLGVVLRIGLAAAGIVVLLGPASHSVSAQTAPHRARLARDLAERLATGSNEVGRVILEGDPAYVDRLAHRYGLRVTRRLQHGAVVELNGGQLDALSQDPEVDHLSSDLPVRSTMAVTVQSTGADQVWQGAEGVPGLTGRGVGVAVIDSGIADHPALRDRVVTSVDFTGDSGAVIDQFGHGTHVAGIIAGSDPLSGFAGIAIGAHLVNLRAIGFDGYGRTSDVIAAIDWAIAYRHRYAIRVINLSLGHPVMESYSDDPLCRAVQRANDAGILVVASVGNLGQTMDGTQIIGGVHSPANSPYSFAVGAIDTHNTAWRSDDTHASWSSVGPTFVDNFIKPDISAPGRHIISTASPGSKLWRERQDRRIQIAPGSHYLDLSGTSQAAAVVSGAAALLLEANPELSPLELRLLLQYTAEFPAGADVLAFGAGSLNVLAASRFLSEPSHHVPITTDIAGEQSVSSGYTFINCHTQCANLSSAELTSPSTAVLLSDSILWTANILWTTSTIATSNILWTNGILWTSTVLQAANILWTNGLYSPDSVSNLSILWTTSMSHSQFPASSVRPPD